MKRKIIFLSVLLLFGVCLVSAQQISVSGVVTDASDGSPVVGASIKVKGTKSGTVSDLNGKFSLSAEEGATLVFSYIGMIKQEITVKSKIINVKMVADSHTLNEVVAIGYGVQKKKLVTGATVQVGGESLQKLSTTSAFTALQSQTPGVNIVQSTGQPGDGFKVTIRGLGTVGSYAPLYVIDGVTGGDLNSLNTSDIESIDVLKDAASCAIYGARAANGVVIISTKQGKSGKLQVSLDSYYGAQNVYKMPSLLNAQQYMNIENEVQFNEGLDLYNWKDIVGSTYYNAIQNGTWKGTNWLDAIRNKNASIQNHSINIVGGNDLSKYSMGVSYTAQEGIFGAPVASNYERTTVRMNSDHVLLKLSGRDVVKIGENLNYNYSIKSGIGTGNQYWNDISNMLRAMPIMPLYNSDGEYFNHADKDAMGSNDEAQKKLGKPTNLTAYETNAANPIADMVYERGNNTSKSHNLNMNVNLQIQPIKNLLFKSQFGYKMNASSYRSYKPTYDLSTSTSNKVSSVTQSGSLGWSYSWENTLNYKLSFDKHHIDALIGQSMEKWGMGESFGSTNGNLLFDGYKYAYLDNSKGVATGVTSVSGSPYGQGGISSGFGRVNYDYNETYMATVIMRADGSSNFAKGHRWGYFPSISGGWVISNEPFMESTKNYIDYLKLRASWGQNGNCNIAPFQYLSVVSFDATAAYSYGNNKDTQTTGGYAKNTPNPDVTWETSEQTDLGVDFHLFNSKLKSSIDYYNKLTKNWLIVPPSLASFGTSPSYANGGDVRNRGIEVSLSWNDQIGKDFTYGVNTYLAYNSNKVTRIANTEKIFHGQPNVLAQGTTEMYRAQEGYPIGYFWGYKTAGVFQNQADIDAWKAAGNPILQTNVQPGDLKFVDNNKDGKITDADKTQIGDPNPHYNLGLNFNIGYKGFDLTVAAHGAFGMQIMKNYRQTSRTDNYTTEVFNRWHGEGTSNRWPRLTANTNVNYQYISDIYVENGDYLKCQNITLGYDFKKLFKGMPLQQARLYVTAQNLFTITGYSGMDPEIGSNAGTSDSWASGIDIGYYPSPRTYLVGLNIKF